MKKILTAIFLLSFSISGSGMELNMNFNDLVSNAHVILAGRCNMISSVVDHEHGGIISTRVRFDALEVVRQNQGNQIVRKEFIEIDYLGGEAEGRVMEIGNMPHFEVGTTYLLFILNDGKKYISPLIGGNQGVFMIKTDEISGERYIEDVNSYGITAVNNFEIQKTRFKISAISNGQPKFIFPASQSENLNSVENPMKDSSDETITEDNASKLISLTEFINLIRIHVFDEPSLLKWEKNKEPMPCKQPQTDNKTINNSPADRMGGPLGACKFQDVYIGLENVPSSWTSNAININSRSNYDAFMNIYSNSYIGTPGSFGANNGESEFCGWPSNSVLHNVYGFYWGAGSLAVTISYSSCSTCEIVESDIAFNPVYTWVYNWNSAFQTTNINYRTVLIHELGHTWGYQVGSNCPETYDYDYPSVMHSYYNNVWEDGFEIHYKDAYIYRNLYDNQTTVLDVDDVGVESYYASNGLNNCYVSSQTSQSFKVNNVTVENNSDDPQNNVHLRFYLSTNRVLSSSDYLVYDTNWNSFAAESRSVNDYTLPTTSVPPGVYYVCARVSINGYASDDRPANDITWSTFTVQVIGGVGISEIDDSHQLNIFPNPVTENVKIQLPEITGKYNLKLWDVNGKSLLPTYKELPHGESTLEIEMKELPKGIYMLILTDQEQKSFMGKIVKQ